MSKKATMIDITAYFFKIFAVIVIAVILVGIVFYYINETFDTSNLEAKIIYAKLSSSPDCFAYTDANNKAYPNLIDLSKFNFQSLKACKLKDTLGVRLTIRNINNEELKTISIGNPNLITYLPICKASGDFKCSRKSSLVVYIDNQNLKPGFITMEVIQNEG